LKLSIMGPIDARASGQFKIGDTTINRLGYGAMRLTGPGIWGAPSDRGAAATPRRLHEIGVNFIDTADSYGPDVSEGLIREALHPYEGLLIATKVGLTRPGPDQSIPNGRPAYLTAQAKDSLRRLGVEQIDLWQLHRIDPRVPRDEQFGAVRRLLDDGIIRHAGLSEVSVADIEAARRVFPVAAGSLFLNDARRILQDVEDAKRRAERVALGKAGTLRIGIATAVSWHGMVADTFREFRRRQPDVELVVHHLLSVHVDAALATRLPS
jgi:aryl-alcohol dehydrogenase-like predicted oxidoreductase